MEKREGERDGGRKGRRERERDEGGRGSCNDLAQQAV